MDAFTNTYQCMCFKCLKVPHEITCEYYTPCTRRCFPDIVRNYNPNITFTAEFIEIDTGGEYFKIESNQEIFKQMQKTIK